MTLTAFVLASALMSAPSWQQVSEDEFRIFAESIMGKGLADPKAGKFSRVMLKRPTFASKPPMEAYGWVIPGSKRVVAIDGLTYDLASVRGPATISNLPRLTKRESAERWESRWQDPLLGPSWALPALFYLRKEPALAKVCSDFPDYSDPRRELYRFLARRYRQEAHYEFLSGDDLRAKERLLTLHELRETAEKSIGAEVPLENAYLGEEDSRLLAEVEGRLKAPLRINLKEIAGLPQRERILALIDALAEAGLSSIEAPFATSKMDPILWALYLEGEAAMPALITAAESDTRLARAPLMSALRPGIGPLPVKSRAASVIMMISPSTVLGVRSPHIPGAMRQAWKRHEGKSEGQRILDVLSNDRVAYDQWLSVAQLLVRKPLFLDQKFSPTYGESLSSEERLEVSKLLERRVVDQTRPVQERSQWFHNCTKALELAKILYEWAPTESLGALQIASNTMFTAVGNVEGDLLPIYARRESGRALAYRVMLGDKTVLDAYRTEQVFGKRFIRQDANLLRPIYAGRNESAWQEIARQTYADLISESISGGKVDGAKLYYIFILCQTPLVQTAEFRDALGTLLSSDVSYGSARVQAGHLIVNAPGYPDFPFPIRAPQEELSELSQAITVGDAVAMSISRLTGAPVFEAAMPIGLREARKTQIREWLFSPTTDWKAATARFDRIDPWE